MQLRKISLLSLKASLIPILTCASINVCLLAAIAVCQPTTLTQDAQFGNPDASQYFMLGRNIVRLGEYSRCLSAPYQPDVLRTPAFPLFVGILDAVAGPGLVYACTAALHVLNCALLFRIVRRLGGSVTAWYASLFLATDIMVSIYNSAGMSETPSITPVLGALWVLLRRRGLRWRPSDFLWCGVLLGIATLVRPTAQFTPIVFLIGICWTAWNRAQLRGIATASLLLLCSFTLTVAPWMVRNYAILGFAKLTTVDTNNLVYFVGAGAYQVRDGISLEQAQEKIRLKYNIPSYSEVQNPWKMDRSPAEAERQLRAIVPSLLAESPQHLVMGCFIGVVKASLSHATEELVDRLGLKWQRPGLVGLMLFDSAAWTTLVRNPMFLVFTFLWQFSHQAIAAVAACLGLAHAARLRGQRLAATVLILGPFVFYFLTIALFGPDAYFRCRIPLVPFVYVFSALGITLISRRTGICVPS